MLNHREDDRWLPKPEATAIILAGGESRRMGRDKSLLEIAGQPLIASIARQLAFFPERLVGANDPAKVAFLKLPVVPDRATGEGPLMGILSCVERAAHELCFVTACDIPRIDPGFVFDLFKETAGHDIVVPRFGDGQREPLLAVYRKTILPVAEVLLARGERSVLALFEHVRVRTLPFDRPRWYHNLNTPEDLREWLAQENE